MSASFMNTASGVVRLDSGGHLRLTATGEPCIETCANQASPLSALLRGPTQSIVSSAALGWNGILVEKHLSSPRQRGPITIERHVISLVRGCSASIEFSPGRD